MAPDKHYDEMSMRQKALVDMIALDEIDEKGWTNAEIAEAAGEMSETRPYHPTNVSNFRRESTEAIEYRKEMILNERESDEEGKVITVGDPMRKYVGPEEGLDATMQNFDERPTKHVCGECGETFQKQESYASHMRTHSESSDEESQCPEEESSDENSVTVELTEEELFDIFRNASEDVARSVWERVTGLDG